MSVRAVSATNVWSDLCSRRELLLTLTWRDLRVRYKQSLLGIAWAVFLPLSMMLVFTFVFTRAIDASALGHVGMPYALFAYTGLVPWTFFSASLNGCVNSLVANRNLVTKVYFPREVFPLSSVAACFVDFCVAGVVLIALIAYFNLADGWTFVPRATLLFLPVVVCVQVAMTVGIGLLLAMGNLFYRDVRHVFSMAIQLWMFISAVVVPIPEDGSRLARFIALNPMAPIISAYRACILHGQLPAAGGFLYATVIALGLLIGGWAWFRQKSYRFAECI
ncbi:MAG: ABC transporter permease [Phycisphaerae bacterium]